jgi:hypothetical protein
MIYENTIFFKQNRWALIGEWGILDKNGNIIANPQFDWVVETYDD